MTATVERIRKYLSSKKKKEEEGGRRPAGSPPAEVSRELRLRLERERTAEQRRRREQPRPRRRLQRGWWPDTKERAERSVRAMEDLREETFVITEDHIEWTFGDEDSAGGPLEPTRHLIIPSKQKLKNPDRENCCRSERDRCRGRTSNECAICMVEYDVGDVVVHSRNCGHAFHQSCILDWVSRENHNCPSCRAVFYDPEGEEKTKKRASSSPGAGGDGGSDNGGGAGGDADENDGPRDRSDTADTDALSEVGVGDQVQVRGSSDDRNPTDRVLRPVVEL